MTDYSQANPLSQPVFVTDSKVNSAAPVSNASKELALTIVQAGADRKAGDIVLLHVAEVSYIADYFVLMTGYSRVQVRAINQAIQQKVEQELHQSPLRTEGMSEGTWVLQDYGDVLVHIMMPKEREFYNLEAFWGHAERTEFPGASGDGGITK
jgi:ribosome-associated protein